MIRVFCDGACSNNGGAAQRAGIGVVIEWQGRKPFILSEGVGNKTNNEAEYEGILKALLLIKENEIKTVTINSDSALVVNQVNGNWKCRDKKLIPLLIKTQARLNWLRSNNYTIDVVYIKREFNLADAPAKLGKDLENGETLIS